MAGVGQTSFTADDKEILVAIVKTAQQRKIKGTAGGWKEFLASNETGRNPIDPARNPWTTLVKFVETFTTEKDIMMVRRIKKWKKWCIGQEQAEENDPWPDSPEQRLVELTLSNPRFVRDYNFPSYEEGWMCTERGHSSHAISPERLLSMDCEMVACQDGKKEVVKICIVDRNFQVLLDTLVRPTQKVVNYLTEIHGITKDEMEKALCTQEQAQKQVASLLTSGTILVGHSLHNDLEALRIDYRRIIDTAYMFKHKGEHLSFNMSLGSVCESVLGYNFRGQGSVHKCLDDALVPMKIVLHELEHGPTDPFVKGLRTTDNRLFLHKIPPAVSNEDMKGMFSAMQDCKIERVEGKAQAFTVFSSPEAADEAFELLEGELGKDNSGRQQKAVKLFPSSIKPRLVEIRVRKMSIDLSPTRAKRDREGGTTDELAKRMKSSQCSCVQAEELQRLRKLLAARETEILNLKKLITSIRPN